MYALRTLPAPSTDAPPASEEEAAQRTVEAVRRFRQAAGTWAAMCLGRARPPCASHVHNLHTACCCIHRRVRVAGAVRSATNPAATPGPGPVPCGAGHGRGAEHGGGGCATVRVPLQGPGACAARARSRCHVRPGSRRPPATAMPVCSTPPLSWPAAQACCAGAQALTAHRAEQRGSPPALTCSLYVAAWEMYEQAAKGLRDHASKVGEARYCCTVRAAHAVQRLPVPHTCRVAKCLARCAGTLPSAPACSARGRWHGGASTSGPSCRQDGEKRRAYRRPTSLPRAPQRQRGACPSASTWPRSSGSWRRAGSGARRTGKVYARVCMHACAPVLASCTATLMSSSSKRGCPQSLCRCAFPNHCAGPRLASF